MGANLYFHEVIIKVAQLVQFKASEARRKLTDEEGRKKFVQEASEFICFTRIKGLPAIDEGRHKALGGCKIDLCYSV